MTFYLTFSSAMLYSIYGVSCGVTLAAKIKEIIITD